MQTNPGGAAANRWYRLLAAVCDQCASATGTPHVSIGIAAGARSLTTGAASTDIAAQLESYAFTIGEGPYLEALNSHDAVLATDLTEDATRPEALSWPLWTRMATANGIRSVVALPIQAGAITAGVLALYGEAGWHADAQRLAEAGRFVDAALLVLLDMAVAVTDVGALRNQPHDGDGLSVLLRSDVHRAAGMVMAQAGLRIDQALARLRARAFALEQPLQQVAADVLARRIRFDPEPTIDQDGEQAE